ncbi:MAG: hypothetical protein OET90_10270 [Desulfuromonadales bacterium]|nr:hypothetical protein [Desulfuromonadales bacterium]
MLKRVVFVVGVLVCFLCSALLTESFFGSVADAAEQKDSRDEIIHTLKKTLSTEYYDYKTRRIIRVYLDEFTNTIQDEGLIKSYFREGISEFLVDANQFVLGDFDEVGADCLLTMSFDKLGKKFVKITADVTDAQSGRTVASISKSYPEEMFQEESFAAFSKKYKKALAEAKKTGNTRLVIRVNTSGQTVDQYDVNTSTYTSSRSSQGQGEGSYSNSRDYSASAKGSYSTDSSRVSTYETKTKIGRSSKYPTDIVIYVNNRPHKANSRGVAFDQMITPGTYKITVKCRKAFWDGVQEVEFKGEEYSKSFKMKVKKDEQIDFNVGIKLKDKGAVISAKKRKLR